MNILFLWNYPPPYLRYFAATHATAGSLAYREHLDAILDDHAGWAGDLCRHMAREGIDARFVLMNAADLQCKWADENGFRNFSATGWERAIALEQVRRLRPDVVWLTPRFDLLGEFTQALAAMAGRVVLWVGEPWPAGDVRGVAVLVTENPETFKAVQHRFERVVVTRPGYDPAIARRLEGIAKTRDVVFAGQILRVHARRARLLASLARHGLPLELFGSTPEDALPGLGRGLREAAWHLARERSPRRAAQALRRAVWPSRFQRDATALRPRFQPPVFGMDLYRLLAGARLVINVHGDIAGRHAGNMRMFETTLAGACLVTERADNIRTLFEPGREVLTFGNERELLRVVAEALSDPQRTAEVARAGRERTLRDHTTARFFEELRPALGL